MLPACVEAAPRRRLAGTDGGPGKLGDLAATWEAPRLSRAHRRAGEEPRRGGKAGRSTLVWHETRLLEGRGRLREPGGAGVGAGGSGNSQEIPSHSRMPRPFPWVPTSPNPGKEKMQCYSGFLAVLLSHLGLERGWERKNTGAPELRPSCERGVRPPPGAPERAAARSRSPSRRPAAPVPFSLSWCHMSRGGVGTRGVGGGVRAGKGPPSPPICAVASLTDARNSQ